MLGKFNRYWFVKFKTDNVLLQKYQKGNNVLRGIIENNQRQRESKIIFQIKLNYGTDYSLVSINNKATKIHKWPLDKLNEKSRRQDKWKLLLYYFSEMNRTY